VVACTLKLAIQPQRLLRLLDLLSPFLTLLAGFAAFILWNGSVVLGDKSNHTATLHLPQMLYIWPFITFFSWPLVYQYLLLLPFSLLAQIPAYAGLETLQVFKRKGLLPHLWITLGFLGLACTVVYFNTVVHPFTLADNRHYVFYAFRKLLHPWWIRYAVTPIYFLCAWALLASLGGGPGPAPASTRRAPSGLVEHLALADGQSSATTSFVLIWLTTSALQLITAPLVEPRYFILPWIFWRMHVPLCLPPKTSGQTEKKKKERPLWVGLWEDYDHRLWFETAWMLAVNAGTGYIFLNWGFEWPQEPGRVQRFMW
jgi:alpha-1,2-glucosyltransferase